MNIPQENLFNHINISYYVVGHMELTIVHRIYSLLLWTQAIWSQISTRDWSDVPIYPSSNQTFADKGDWSSQTNITEAYENMRRKPRLIVKK